MVILISCVILQHCTPRQAVYRDGTYQNNSQPPTANPASRVKTMLKFGHSAGGVSSVNFEMNVGNGCPPPFRGTSHDFSPNLRAFGTRSGALPTEISISRWTLGVIRQETRAVLPRDSSIGRWGPQSRSYRKTQHTGSGGVALVGDRGMGDRM